MRILILNHDYSDFLRWHLANHPGIAALPYSEQLTLRNQTLFGAADFYSEGFKRLGNDAVDFHSNNEPLQRAWLRENSVRLPSETSASARFRKVFAPWKPCVRFPKLWPEIILAQIHHYKPDVVLNQSLDRITGPLVREIKHLVPVLAGQIAAPLRDDGDLSSYDILFSSLPNFIARFRAAGLRAEWCPLAFEPKVLNTVKPAQRDIPISFVGSISIHHPGRTRLLELLCEKTEIQLWGTGLETLPAESPLRKSHRGPAWGRQMFEILGRSIITINHHIGVSEGFANNMRLYEATGMGAALVTDLKSNLHELFAVGSEVVAYQNDDACLASIHRLLKDSREVTAVAAAGQRRTLQDHTFDQLTSIVNSHLTKLVNK